MAAQDDILDGLTQSIAELSLGSDNQKAQNKTFKEEVHEKLRLLISEIQRECETTS